MQGSARDGVERAGGPASVNQQTSRDAPTFDVVCLGEPMYEFSQIPGKSREYLQGFGGDTMNCAIAAARQGARVAYVCRVGDDAFGKQMFDLWEREGIDATAVMTDADAHTAVYFISHGESGHTFSYLRKGSAASRFTADDLPAAMLRDTRFFYSSGISQAISDSACDAVFAGIDIARKAGARIVYDANFRPALWSVEKARKLVRQTAGLTDYLLLSLEDAEALTGLSETSPILDWCAGAGAAVAILKLGADGAIYRHNGADRRVHGFPVEAVDATGAGDCFAGALMARLSADDSLDDAIEYACSAAAITCGGYGAIDPVPRAPEVRALVSARSASGGPGETK